MSGRFGKYGDIKRKANIRQSERVKQRVSKPKASDHRKERLRKKRNNRSTQQTPSDLEDFPCPK